MKTITVCIGSSCHLKGSYDVVQELQKIIKENNLESDVSVKASFCLGECTKGVSVKIDEGPVLALKKENVMDFFNEYVITHK